MDDNTKELEQYWDEFSQEYEEIQNESLVDIGQQLKEFLVAEKLLPTSQFLDLAGGTAKNKSADSNKITFTHQEQNKFLKNTKENTYDFVFSAMNPALESKEALVELNRIANGNVGILCLIFDEDNLFSQVEQLYLPNQEQNKEAQMLLYKVWLEELGWEFKSKKFRFFLSEKVSSQFFSDYFSDELSNTELAALTQLFFSETEIREMERLVIFELLYWEKC